MRGLLQRASLRARILGAYLLAFTFFTLAIGYGIWQLRALGEGLTALDLGYVPLSRSVSRMDGALVRVDIDAERLLSDPPRRLAAHRSNLNLYTRLINDQTVEGRSIVARVLPKVGLKQERANLTTLDAQLQTLARLNQTYLTVCTQALDLADQQDAAGVRTLAPELSRARQALRSELDKLSTRVETRIRRVSERTAVAQREAQLIAGALGLVALFAGLVMLALAVLALRPIGRLTQQVQRIAGGDVGARVELQRKDELGVLAEEINIMAGAIEEREGALQRARAELRSVLDSIRLALIVESDGRVTLSNPAAEALFGVREGDPLPESLRLPGLGDGEEAAPMEGRLLDLRRVPFRGGSILVGEDITERVVHQARLARSERLALVGQMLAQITHEVRNPLNALSLNAELLGDDLEDLPDERRDEARAILGTITAEIRHLERVTEHYLTLARRPTPSLHPEDPAALIGSVVSLLDEELRRAGVTLTVEAAEGPPVDLDAHQLRRALLNVARNAVEAGAKQLTVRVERDEGKLRFVIDDDGAGFSAEEAERAFDPFFSTKATGTGLGLAITRQILEDHGGVVRAEHKANGARLVLELPAARLTS